MDGVSRLSLLFAFITDKIVHHRTKKQFCVRQLAVFYIAVLAVADPGNRERLQIEHSASTFIEQCNTDPPLHFDHDWHALSQQREVCLEILRGSQTLPTSFDLQFIEHLQLDSQQPLSARPYWIIFRAMLAKILVLSHHYQRYDQGSNIPPGSGPLTSYEIVGVNTSLSISETLLGVVRTERFLNKPHIICVSPPIVKGRKAMSTHEDINIGKISSLRASVFTTNQESSRRLSQQESNQSQVEVCIGRNPRSPSQYWWAQSFKPLIVTSWILVPQRPVNILQQLPWTSHSNAPPVTRMAESGTTEHVSVQFGPDHELWDLLQDGDIILLRAWPQSADWIPPVVHLELRTRL